MNELDLSDRSTPMAPPLTPAPLTFYPECRNDNYYYLCKYAKTDFYVTASQNNRRRLSQVTAKLDNGPQGTLSYAYDSLGRMASISRGTALDNTQYTYTLQGWLETAISTSFEETLRYQNPSFSATDALPGKAGLITEWAMQQKGESGTGGTSTHTTYAFSYDKAGRLTNSLRYLEPSMIGTVTLAERDITYDASGNLLTLKRYGNSSTTPIDSLSYSYDGPKRIGWSYDPNGNVTSDATNGVSIDWNVIDLPRAITSGTSSTQRFYLADGTLSHIQDGTQMRLYWGDIVFKISPGSFGIESAGWEGGRLLPGTGNDKVLYYVNDHLGSVRVVKNGNGFIKQRFDYYPYGSVSRGWWGELGADNPEKRYRFGGKEIAGTASNATATGSDTYLDFGARLYNPRTALWMSQDPMAEDYYRITQYAYCHNNPLTRIDITGKNDYYFDARGNWQIQYTNDEFDRLFAPNGSVMVVDDQSIMSGMASVLYPVRWGDDAIMDETLHFTTSLSSNSLIMDVFYFLADNTDVEWIVIEGPYGENVLATEHNSSGFKEKPLIMALKGRGKSFYSDEAVFRIHSHPLPYSSEMESMIGDYENVKLNPSMSNYVYFPASKNVYKITAKKGPQLWIKK